MTNRVRNLRRALFPKDGARPETQVILSKITRPGRVEYAVFTWIGNLLRNGYYSRELELCVAEYETRKRVTANPGETPQEFFVEVVK